MAVEGPVALCVLDGWGNRKERAGNAVALAQTPNFDSLMQTCPSATLVTHGEAVGLPPGNIGNSEVGHLHIGAGRTVMTELCRVDAAIAGGQFRKSEAILDLVRSLRSSGGTAHLIGLVSDVGVHSLMSHLLEAAHALGEQDIPVTVHALTDGRDSPPGRAPAYLAELQDGLPAGVQVSTVGGRYYAMDRDRRWDRVEKAWRCIVLGEGPRVGTAGEAIDAAFAAGLTDEFIIPTVVGNYGGIRDGDGLFIVNFRSDRVRQIGAALADPGFSDFDVSRRPMLAASIGMTEYFSPAVPWMPPVFPKLTISNTLGEVVSRAGLRQFRLAETEKFPHVTFFLNGGREELFEGESRCMPPSPKVATYDLVPEMSAGEVTREFVKAVEGGHDLIVCNFANPDMVGHTGNLEAAIRACEAVDRGLGTAVDAIQAAGGAMIVTADHGNCEQMIDPETGGVHTAHTTNSVPVVMLGAPAGKNLRPGALSDLAPTILDLLGIDQPEDMTGRSLLYDPSDAPEC